MSALPFAENVGLKQLINATVKQTKEEFKNITGSLGFAVKVDGKIVFKPIAEYFQKTLDGAMFDITSGAFDYNTVLRRVVNEMTTSGLRTVDYATGWSNRTPVAVRRAVMTGFSQVTGKINEDNADTLETEYFEVTRHVGARPSHQIWQGKVYSKKQLETVCGYGTGDGLCGWNCRHDFFLFIPGISERTYTDEQLSEMNEQENTPKMYKGKEYTAYTATQQQRKLETLMRKQRQDIKLLKDGGADENDIINARCRYRSTSAQYTAFSKAMNLPQQRERVYIDGLGNVGGGKVTKAVDSKVNSGIITNKITNNIDKIKAQSWNNNIKPEDKAELIDKFNKATPKELEFWSKYGKLIKGNFYDNSTAGCYKHGSKTVHLNISKIDARSARIGDTKDNRLFFHETGHLFDNNVLGENRKIAIELNNLYDKLNDDYLYYANKLFKEKGLSPLKSFNKLTMEQKRILVEDLYDDMHLKNAVSDICGGLTNNRIQGAYGHDSGYWKRLYAVEAETVAHMFECTMMKGERLEIFKKYFPSSYSYFYDYIMNL